jgi:hypothetical protein
MYVVFLFLLLAAQTLDLLVGLSTFKFLEKTPTFQDFVCSTELTVGESELYYH